MALISLRRYVLVSDMILLCASRYVLHLTLFISLGVIGLNIFLYFLLVKNPFVNHFNCWMFCSLSYKYISAYFLIIFSFLPVFFNFHITFYSNLQIFDIWGFLQEFSFIFTYLTHERQCTIIPKLEVFVFTG